MRTLPFTISLFFALFFSQPYHSFSQTWDISNPMTTLDEVLPHNSGIFVSGFNDSSHYHMVTVIKYSYDGKKLFDTRLPVSSSVSDTEIDIDTLPNSSDLIVLSANAIGVSCTFSLIRLDSLGQIVWIRTFSNSNSNNHILVDATTKTGEIITLTADSSDNLEFRTWDTSGNELFYKPLGINIRSSSVFLDKAITKSLNGYLVFEESMAVIKVDTNGNKLWKQHSNWFFHNSATLFTLADKNTLMLWADQEAKGVYTNPFLGYYLLNPSGTIIKTNRINVPFTEIKNIFHSNDNGYIICGELDSGIISGSWGYGSFANVVWMDSNFNNPKYMEYHPFMNSISHIYQYNQYFIGLGYIRKPYPLKQDYHLFCNKFSFKTIDWKVGLLSQEPILLGNIDIFPNPAKETLHIHKKSLPTLSFSLQTIMGDQIIESTLAEEFSDIDVSSLKNGIYILVFQNQDGRTTRKKVIIE